MKTSLMTLAAVLTATIAFASESAVVASSGILIWCLLGFGALVIVMQLIPSLVMLYSMIKGIFAQPEINISKN